MDIKWEKEDQPNEMFIEIGDVIAVGESDQILYAVICARASYKLLSLPECQTLPDYWETASQLNNWLIKAYESYRLIKNRRLELTIKKP
jgi:hypothetical protein